jgi:uncharacterized protein
VGDASFDCRRASNAVERAICNDSALAALDRQLGNVYQQSLDRARVDSGPGGVDDLQREERQWVARRNNCGGRNIRNCLTDAYQYRTAYLQARWALVPGNGPMRFVCDDRGRTEITATFFMSDPPAVSLETRGRNVIGVATLSGSGVHYVADGGISFRNKGDGALVDWPPARNMNCMTRQPR